MSEATRDHSSSEDRLNKTVFYGSFIGIVGFSLWAMIATEQANRVINAVLGWIANTFGWYYFLTVVVYLAFVIFLGVSRFGKIRLGPEHARPDFNIFSWSAMLFSAGIGIGVIFFALAEPLTQFYKAPGAPEDQIEAARYAMQLTFLHWGLSGWGIYTLVGMSLAFFSYRHNLPLTISSALYPIFGKKIYGPIGHAVDIAAVLGTVFGIAASLGIGVIQLNYGLNFMFGITESAWTQTILVLMIVLFATISAVTGVERGIRRLSEFNILLAVALLLFVLFAGKTIFLLNALVMNIGDYLSSFVRMSFDTYAFDRPTEWLNGWTLFFWAWWIAWGPFVGLFLARISRGRTIRTFVAGTLTLPIAFMMIWMSLLGNSAIDMAINGATDFGQQVMANPPSGIYLFLQEYPFPVVTTIAVSVLAIVFFVTSGDSGALVLSNFTSVLKDVSSDAPVWMRILWSAVIGILTLALLLAGGLSTLQSAVVITGLPFSVVLFFMMAGLYKALKVEAFKEESYRLSLAGSLSGRMGSSRGGRGNWEQRLDRAMNFPDRSEAQGFLEERVRPAMMAIKDRLEHQDVGVHVNGGEQNEHDYLALNVDFGEEQNFTYQVWTRAFATPAFAMRTRKASSNYYRLEVHLLEGSQGYDLMGYSEQQVIDDILDQYERHLQFLHLNRMEPGSINMPDSPEQPPV
ncbi:choline BCCT transporter BetT [Kushneria marisflavi]|uniref:High-affinity choline transporter BetT n=1 Tax=Kushneria marisflavi TaxID=157779 RepID=A0A240UQW8_9GAMM|nr:choline BCCT transporter BetT [Kushneria marisflavi]ART63432.1 high-affinity choline transporter BetT [Kushneria marisflavi]RKD84489.1 choline/glycine/proline betaine transport protein [Kushneria marisflavi]